MTIEPLSKTSEWAWLCPRSSSLVCRLRSSPKTVGTLLSRVLSPAPTTFRGHSTATGVHNRAGFRAFATLN
jgi:hypothetical protein